MQTKISYEPGWTFFSEVSFKPRARLSASNASPFFCLPVLGDLRCNIMYSSLSCFKSNEIRI